MTAGAFGCKPADRFFSLNSFTAKKLDKWNLVEFNATVPSVLYDSTDCSITIDPRYSAVFGIPPHELVVKAGKSWQKVNLKGKVFIRQVAPKITLVYGAVLAADHAKCDALIDEILQLMTPAFEAHKK